MVRSECGRGKNVNKNLIAEIGRISFGLLTGNSIFRDTTKRVVGASKANVAADRNSRPSCVQPLPKGRLFDLLAYCKSLKHIERGGNGAPF